MALQQGVDTIPDPCVRVSPPLPQHRKILGSSRGPVEVPGALFDDGEQMLNPASVAPVVFLAGEGAAALPGWIFRCWKNGSPAWTRTRNQVVNSHLLYQLSYRGTFFNDRGKEENIVEVPVVSRSCAAKTLVATGECENASYPCKERSYAGGHF